MHIPIQTTKSTTNSFNKFQPVKLAKPTCHSILLPNECLSHSTLLLNLTSARDMHVTTANWCSHWTDVNLQHKWSHGQTIWQVLDNCLIILLVRDTYIARSIYGDQNAYGQLYMGIPQKASRSPAHISTSVSKCKVTPECILWVSKPCLSVKWKHSFLFKCAVHKYGTVSTRIAIQEFSYNQ